MRETKPYTLRSRVVRSVTIHDKLFLFNYLSAKDESVPKSTLKYPVRIMDFNRKLMLNPEYPNDDSTGTVNGDSGS